jgi:hypothetical protein
VRKYRIRLLPRVTVELQARCRSRHATELSNWVEQRGSTEVADNVRGALKAIDRNEEFIKMTLAVLMTQE